MKALLSFSLGILATQSSAENGTISGRMICEVVASRFVSATEAHGVPAARSGDGFPLGASLTFDYTLDAADGLTIHLNDDGRKKVLIDELFPADVFKGPSRSTNVAEYRASYSEVSVGRYGMNYKGSDQLFIKTACEGDVWPGHYVRTYVGGHVTQVVSLDCRPSVDAVDEILARMKALR